MALFSNKNRKALSPRELLEYRYNSARHDLLILVILSVINLILLATNSNTYFLFSAFIPYTIVFYGMFLSGRLPAEDYEYYLEASPDELYFYDDTFFYIMVAIAVIIIALYLLCFIFSSKCRYGWLIAALIIFIPDTLFLVLGDMGTNFIDLIFHIIVIGYLIWGIFSCVKLKKLPEDELKNEGEEQSAAILTSENTGEGSEEKSENTEESAKNKDKSDGTVDF